MVTVTHGARAGRGLSRYGRRVGVAGLVGGLLAALVTGTPAAWAQWTTNGASISYTTGNVAIGTATPAPWAKLDVVGDVSLQGGGATIGGTPVSVVTSEAAAKALLLKARGGANPDFVVATTGNVGIGTATPAALLHVAGNAQVDGNIAAKYQDVAEWVRASSKLSPGTVVAIDTQESNRVVASDKPYDTRVAGVVSLQPGIVLGEPGEDKAMVAQSGRVRVKVDANYGSIAVGDLLVTSPIRGYAMRSAPVNVGGAEIHRPGTLIGKALEPLAAGQGEILVLLTLQ